MAERRKAKGKGRGGPRRGYSWPPFEPGNKVPVKHGAQSPELVEARARELAPVVLEANPHLDPTRDGPATLRYCAALARCERVYRWLAQQDDEVFADREAGDVHGVYSRLETWERAAAAAEDQLAISPAARVRLGLDLARASNARRSLRDYVDGDAVGDDEGGDDG